MKTNEKYKRLKTALEPLSKEMNLTVIEKHLSNNKILYAMQDDVLILNTNYHEFVEVAY